MTKADFINKLVIARKEAKETKYWLKIISAKYIKQDKIEKDIGECTELVRIFSAIINKSK